jgi:integrase
MRLSAGCGSAIRDRAIVTQRKTGRPVQFEITEVTRQSVEQLLADQSFTGSEYLFQSRTHRCPHISARQCARIVHQWIGSIGLDERGFGTHSLRRTKVAQLYRKTGNRRAVQLLLGHATIETTVRHLGVEVDDALRLAEQIEL